MSLGNVPRRNMSAEDAVIKLRLLAYDALVRRHMQLGLSKTEAGQRALSAILTMSRNRLVATIENLNKLAKVTP